MPGFRPAGKAAAKGAAKGGAGKAGGAGNCGTGKGGFKAGNTCGPSGRSKLARDIKAARTNHAGSDRVDREKLRRDVLALKRHRRGLADHAEAGAIREGLRQHGAAAAKRGPAVKPAPEAVKPPGLKEAVPPAPARGAGHEARVREHIEGSRAAIARAHARQAAEAAHVKGPKRSAPFEQHRVHDDFLDNRKANPHAIPPGPIAGRIEAYHAGEVKRRKILEIEAIHEPHLESLRAAMKPGPEGAELGRKFNVAEYNLSLKHPSKAARARAQAEYDAARGALDAHVAKSRDAFARYEQARAAMTDHARSILAVDNPVAMRLGDYAGDRLKTNAGPEIRAAAEQGAGFFGSVYARGGRKGGDRLDLAVAQPAPGAYQRAHYQEGTSTVMLARSDRPDVAVHEFGHAADDLHGLGYRSKEFLAHRVGNEEPRPMNELVKGEHYEPHEMGRSDKFGDAFGDSAAYVGKVYRSPTSSEVTAMGVQKLYEDPIHFARADPEYFRYTAGILDGSLR